jgi:hypothetical protein
MSSVDTTYCPVYHISRTCLACSWSVMWLSCSSINAQGRSGSCTAILTQESRISNKRNTDTRHVQPRLAPRVTRFLLVGGKMVRDQMALLNRYGTFASTKPRTDVFMVA